MQLRMTNQREMILRELKKSEQHLSADELYERVKKFMPRISLATVYRNLEILSDLKMIRKLEISGRQKRFDSELEEHDHIFCIECRRIDNLDIGTAKIELPVNETKGYAVTGRRLEVTGLCPVCQKKLENIENITLQGATKMGCGCKKNELNEKQREVLEAMNKCDSPCAAKDIAAAVGKETKHISCQMTALKKKGFVDSPVRCKYEITSDGKSALKA